MMISCLDVTYQFDLFSLQSLARTSLKIYPRSRDPFLAFSTGASMHPNSGHLFFFAVVA